MSRTAGQLWTVSINLKCLLASPILWSVALINYGDRVCFLIGWQLLTLVCQSFTRQIRIYQHEKVGEQVGKNRASSICRQQFANLFGDCFCAVHTCQLEFANTRAEGDWFSFHSQAKCFDLNICIRKKLKKLYGQTRAVQLQWWRLILQAAFHSVRHS